MNQSEKTRKIGIEKIAFLALFIIALIIARFVVQSKSAIRLSGPIMLDYAGLSISMPQGNGWKTERSWRYYGNIFTLNSRFFLSRSNVTANAQCLYVLLDDENLTASVDWAYFKKPQSLSLLFFGTATVPGNQRIEIELRQATADELQARQAFMKIAKSIKLYENKPLKAGEQLVAQIKNEGLNSLLKKSYQQSFFLLKDAKRRVIGFTMDLLTSSELNIEAETFYYIANPAVIENATLFQGDNNFSHFIWKSQTDAPAVKSAIETTLDENGYLTIRNFNTATEQQRRLRSASIPEIFLDWILVQMLKNSCDKIIVDMIRPEGTVTPVAITRINTAPKDGAVDKNGYLVKLQFLDNTGFYIKVYLDEQFQIYKSTLRQKHIYILERSSKENILKLFPQRADYIRDKIGAGKKEDVIFY
ncbi:MAG: hypothetical protein ACYSRR_07585 [Planctomycetota bacterium]|jgi:hypothetical protein